MDNTSTVTQVLSGHTSPETAYVVADYPYGFTLRCQIRYWVETKRGHGQRVVSQTSNPKKPGLVWNKPKAGTYAIAKVLYLDEKGYVQNTGISGYSDDAEIGTFLSTFEAGLDEPTKRFIEAFQAARIRVRARIAEKRAAQEAING